MARLIPFLCLIALALVTLPEAAFAGQGAAGGSSTIAKSLCDIISMITGPAGRAIASLAVIVIGISALLGRVQWNQAIVVCVGIAVIFGAQPLLEEMTKGTPNSAGVASANCRNISPNPPAPLLNGPLAQTLCNVVAFFSGRVGQALATIGIIIMGIMALLGKLQPQYALMVAAGIALIFGSANIVRDLAPQGTFSSVNSSGIGVGNSGSCRPLLSFRRP